MPLLASNFTSNLLYGTTIVAGGWANVDLTVDAFAFEGDKTFAVKLRKDSTLGQVIGTSAPITIKDYTTIVGLSANISTVNEGNLVQFTLTTTNVVNYTNVAYSVFPATANVTADDFVANTGYITIINNVGTFALKANADVSLMDENGENFRVQIRDRNSTNVFISSNITIGDVSRGVNVVSFVESAVTAAEGGTLTLTFTATNANNVIIFYSTDGNATTATFAGGNTGSFILNGLSNTFTLLPTGVPYGTTQNFTVKLRSDTATGPVIATSNNLIVLDSSIAYMTATGGTIVDSGGYRIHAFTTSGNLTVSALGAGAAQNFADYLIVAGGAAGGRAGGSMYAGGGGGGAGGALLSNITFTSTGNSVITVGAGGAIRAHSEWPLLPGGNTTVIFTGTPTIIALGGGGGAHSWPDHGAGFGGARSGGSGGGGNTFTGYPAGAGTPGQGYPGGASSPTSFGGVSGSFAGGGGGAGEAGHYQPTDPVSPVSTTTQAGGNGIAVPWAPASYGTPGPAPGRYFSGGGGGGASPAGSAYILSGGAGGGGAGGNYTSGYPTSARGLGTSHGGLDGGANATINTGGGGGGAGQGGASSGTGLAGTGGSGIVLIRYPYAPSITVSNVLTTSNVFAVGSNITFTINAQNANLLTLYYSTDGNVTSTNFIGGNTGSFVANASGGIVTLKTNPNIPLNLNESRSFRLQIRQDSTTGFISGSSANIIISNILIVTYLAVAGGGGGQRGGGGAGGLLASTFNAPVGDTIVITVGGGGAGGVPGGAGSNSIISSGPSFANIIAIGGGWGGPPSGNGGSGGGAGFLTQFGSGYNYPGPAQQGYPGGSGDGAGSGGGGGGAGAVGQNVDGAAGGRGGNGALSSINGTSLYYAGGGGAGGTGGGNPGGLGGGGTGVWTGGATTGNVNTGGGGGGTSTAGGVAGGSGIVTLRFPSSTSVVTSTGNVLVTTDGSSKVYQYYGSGTIKF
jgi:hypothetical protein